MNHWRLTFIVLYFSALLLLAPINLLSFDTFYYWDWSRHLAMSYYDGPPMIAYFIKASTLMFGDTLFALCFVGIMCAALICFIIYKTARLFLSQNASYVAVGLCLFSPLVTSDIFRQTTYDTPLLLFWAWTLYLASRWIIAPKNWLLYAIGVSIGLMLLSKYTGVVLVLALLIFIISSSHRKLFKNPHLYGAALTALVLFSPVLFWNMQHEWLSFTYQLSAHHIRTSHAGMLHVVMFLGEFILVINLMALPALICWKRKAHQTQDLVKLYMVVCTTFFLFFLILSYTAKIRVYWLTPYLISSACLGGYCFEIKAFRKAIYAVLALYFMVSTAILINNTTRFHMTHQPKWEHYAFIEALNESYPHAPKVVLTSGWMQARGLFFLKDKPIIETLGCHHDENQYLLWRGQRPSIQKTWYIDDKDRVACVRKYFKHCEPLVIPSQVVKKTADNLVAYFCTNE